MVAEFNDIHVLRFQSTLKKVVEAIEAIAICNPGVALGMLKPSSY